MQGALDRSFNRPHPEEFPYLKIGKSYDNKEGSLQRYSCPVRLSETGSGLVVEREALMSGLSIRRPRNGIRGYRSCTINTSKVKERKHYSGKPVVLSQQRRFLFIGQVGFIKALASFASSDGAFPTLHSKSTLAA
jgi:hypothetical protein